MTTLKNSRYLSALRREPVDCTPIWIMRQAGRYLPEYRRVRQTAGNFLKLCKTPEYACEVTLQPLDRFELDAAILFSDILTIPDAMGLGLTLEEGVGPRFNHPLESTAQVEALALPDVADQLHYVTDTIKLLQTELNGRVPLIGFSGSPWTLATYMVEGGSSKNFAKVKGMMHAEPQTMALLLDKLAQSVTEYLKAQIKAGVQSIMIFDTWGGILSTRDYRQYSLEPMRRIVAQLKQDDDTRDVPVTLFTKGGAGWLEAIADTGCDAIGLDWTIDIDEAERRVGDRVALQGNMDPTVLYADDARVKVEVQSILSKFNASSGHVFNLGHGIHPDINPERVKTLVDSVHHISKR